MIWIGTSEGKRYKAGLKAVTIYAAVRNSERAGCIANFVLNLLCMLILILFYLHCHLRATSRHSPHNYLFFLCIVPRNVLKLTLKGLLVKTCTDHSYSKTNQMHQYIKFIYFRKALYMFWTVFQSIISSSRLYIQQQAFVKKILLSAC